LRPLGRFETFREIEYEKTLKTRDGRDMGSKTMKKGEYKLKPTGLTINDFAEKPFVYANWTGHLSQVP
jgi:hypothetical protein